MWFVKTIQDVLLSTIKPLFEEQKKQIDERFDGVDKRFEGVDQRFTALHTEIGTQTSALKKEMVLSIAPMFEESSKRDRKIEERITNEIRRVIVLNEQLRLEMKDTMASTQMITEHESVIKDHGSRIENIETEVHTIKTVMKKSEQTI